MKAQELRSKSEKELRDLLTSARETIAEARFYARNSRSRNVKNVRSQKRLVSRILTVLREK